MYINNDGTKSRITIIDDRIVKDKRIVYPETDFRMEYRGELKNDRIMNGEGTLVLRDGSSFTGDWIDGIN